LGQHHVAWNSRNSNTVTVKTPLATNRILGASIALIALKHVPLCRYEDEKQKAATEKPAPKGLIASITKWSILYLTALQSTVMAAHVA
jgi:hypothetical protein